MSITMVRTTSTRAVELQNGLAALLVGVFLLLPIDTFLTAPGYRMFAHWAPEEVWGVIFLVLGGAQLVVAVVDRIVLRRICASLLGVLFAVYVGGILTSNPASAATPFVVPMILAQAWAFYQVRTVK